MSSFRSAFERAGLTLEFRATPRLPLVYVDREMWEKIVLNLVSNAFKFTLCGDVRVEVGPADESMEMAVIDTGTGIPAAELPKIFKRFERVEGAAGREPRRHGHRSCSCAGAREDPRGEDHSGKRGRLGKPIHGFGSDRVFASERCAAGTPRGEYHDICAGGCLCQ